MTDKSPAPASRGPAPVDTARSVAVYPGSFDPITNGHLDVIKRGLRVFEKLIITVGDNPGKAALFSKDERVEMIREVTRGLRGVEADSFAGLVVEYVRRRRAQVILRGVRSVSDFESEYQMALTNRTFAGEIETVFMMAHEEFSFVSSRLIKEAASMGGDVSKFVPKEVEKRLKVKISSLDGSGGPKPEPPRPDAPPDTKKRGRER